MWRVAPVIVLGMVMSLLDLTIVNVALDTLGRDLHATVTSVQWLVTGYMLSVAAVIPISGWMTRRFGEKNVWLSAALFFTLGSALCGLATSMPELIVFRVIQGVGGGLLTPVGQIIMARAAGPKNMGRVAAITYAPATLAPIIGPTLGGVILQFVSWRWIFLVNVPVGAIGIAGGLRAIRASRGEPDDQGIDRLGLVLMALGLPLLTYGLAQIGSAGTINSSKVLVPACAGVVLIATFIWHALRVERPLLQLHLYRRRTFAASSFAALMLGAAMIGSLILLPLYWEQAQHQSVFDTGMLVGAQGIGSAIVMLFVGRLGDRYGCGRIALIGTVCAGLSTLPLIFVGAHESNIWLVAVTTVRGGAVILAYMPVVLGAYGSLEHSEVSDATPQLNVIPRIGGSVGTAILAVVVQRASAGAHGHGAIASAFGTAFAWNFGMFVLTLVPCWWLLVAERKVRAARMDQRETLSVVPDSDAAEPAASSAGGSL